MKTTVWVPLLALAAAIGFTAPASAQSPIAGDWGRFSFRGEYLLWWMKDSPTPVPLVNESPNANAKTLLGGDEIDTGHTSGMRFSVDYWFNPERTLGVELGGFYLPTTTEQTSVSSSGAPGSANLVVPFVDPTLPGANFTPLSLAGSFSGSATEKLTTKFWGIEASMVTALSTRESWRLELLGGFRYLRLGEKYTFSSSSPDLPGGPTSVFQTQDVFDAGNDFYGGQVGVRARFQDARWFADATLKLALGAMNQSVDVAGSLLTNQFTAPAVQSFAGGYFAQPTNIGSHSRTVFAVIPEVGLNVGFRITNWASVFLGYSFLYVSNVARPGNQVDRSINPTQSASFGGPIPKTLTGAASPAFKFNGSDFWAHGLNAGVGISF